MIFIGEKVDIEVPNELTFEELDRYSQEVYELGRADKYQEIVSEYMLLTEEQVEEIRTDTIEEFYNRLQRCKNIDVAYREMIGIV